MDERLEANRENWDARVAVHVGSRFYDVEGWLAERPGPPAREVEVLGDLTGRRLVHLQCHFGLDTLQWARAGAHVVGVDFSPAAIATAVALASRAGLAERARFVCADVYDAPAAVGETFDVVYVSLGALCWLPEVRPWASVVAKLLAPGGRLYLHDVHPLAQSLDDDRRVTYGYFEDVNHPYVDDERRTYTDGPDLAATRNYQWNHGVGEIVGALLDEGLVLDSLVEHDWTVFAHFPWLVESPPGHFTAPDGPAVPLTFTLVAHRPAM